MKPLAAVLVVTSYAALVGCGHPALTPAGSAVQIITADPPPGCTDVGDVSGQAAPPYGSGLRDSKTLLRNEAASKGANYVRLEVADAHDYVAGTAFQCPSAVAAVTPTRAAPAR